MSVKEENKANLPKDNKQASGAGYATGNQTNYDDRGEDYGYVKRILTEQDVITSGIIYRYINNVDPNKDLITDTAKIGGPLKVISVREVPAK